MRTHCIRCGTCCRSSSPTLHPEDAFLIEKGVLRFQDLFTLRVGELVNDNVRGVLRPITEEMIKVGEQKGGACRFFDESQNRCGIYEHRPVQCRELKCWDTSDLERRHNSVRLSREDVLRSKPSLLKLVGNHEERFSYAKLAEAVAEYRNSGGTRADPLMDLLRYEFAFRPFVVDRASIPREAVDFLFGRPFIRTIRMHGMIVEPDEEGVLTLRPVKTTMP